ncbi:glycosyltransferase family protein [Gammaproteobacteria bacterium]|nr:glycosyltransferase family protein [Gammaproteobacteria bacterium]
MKIIASIQARLSSTRLPGKVLKEICGKPMLAWQIERIQKSHLIDDVIVATTTNPADNKIAEFCKKNKISCFRGSEDDVLQRITDLIIKNKVDIHVECFGDSPLVDPFIIDDFIKYLLKNYDDLDFVSNSIKTTYPPGAEVIVYKGRALKKANRLVSSEDPLREHVSLHMYSKPTIFSVKNLEAPPHLNYPDLFIEVDTDEDFSVMSFIIEHINASKEGFFTTSQIIELLKDNPDISSLNTSVKRRWKEYRNEE